jgi:hypothetical protein
MANTTIQLKKSAVSGNVPAGLDYGELALNYADGRLFYKNANGIITYIQSGGASGNSFATINAAGSLILASSNTDILSFAAGTGVNLSACTSSKTITISSTSTATNVGVFSAVSQFTANGVSNTFTLSTTPFSQAMTIVNIDGVTQQHTEYTVVGNQVIFANTPYSGTNIEVVAFSNAGNGIFVTANSTVTANAGTYGSSISIPTITVDEFGRVTYASNNSITVPNDLTSNVIYLQSVNDNQNTYIQSAFDKANSSNILAQAAFNKANTGSNLGVYITNDTYVANGLTDSYTLSATPINKEATIVNFNGVTQQKSQYSLSGNTITFTNTPSVNVSIEIESFVNAGNGIFITSSDVIDSVARSTSNTAINNAASASSYANSGIALAQAAYNQGNSTATIANTKFNTTGGTITGNVTIANNKDLTVTGNLYVQGNTVSVNTSSFTVQDSLIVLATGNYTTDTKDIGFAGHYNAGSNAHAGIVRYSGNKEWYIFDNYTPELDTSNNIDINDASFRTANVNAQTFKGNVIANGVNLGTHVQSAFNQANTDYTTISVTATTYGNTTFIPVVTLTANGRVSAISNTALTVPNANTQVLSLGVGTAASGTTGEIRATNDITAYYSDDRLKTKLGTIENALDKLCTLSGFYYEPNQTAQNLGYEVKRHVGVSAQEVQLIMPEVVKAAPISDQYLTVQYEKLVPLLIEAIKELKSEIDSLKGS